MFNISVVTSVLLIGGTVSGVYCVVTNIDVTVNAAVVSDSLLSLVVVTFV